MRRLGSACIAMLALGVAAQAHADAVRTTHPVVFAHGMAGFDDILGYDYWGDDYGTFVGDAEGTKVAAFITTHGADLICEPRSRG